MNKTIMVADDSKLNIYMLADILKDKYTIIPATSGEDALKLLSKKKLDLLLLDIIMPGLDGFSVL